MKEYRVGVVGYVWAAGAVEANVRPLGDGFPMGGATRPFHGRLDDVLYEIGRREAATLPELIVRGGPTAYVYPHAYDEVREIPVDSDGPEEFEALRIRVLTGLIPEGDGDAYRAGNPQSTLRPETS